MLGIGLVPRVLIRLSIIAAQLVELCRMIDSVFRPPLSKVLTYAVVGKREITTRRLRSVRALLVACIRIILCVLSVCVVA